MATTEKSQKLPCDPTRIVAISTVEKLVGRAFGIEVRAFRSCGHQKAPLRDWYSHCRLRAAWKGLLSIDTF